MSNKVLREDVIGVTYKYSIYNNEYIGKKSIS